MPRYKFAQDVNPDVEWEECFYTATLVVRGGYVETDDPLLMEGLLYRGFTEVAQASDEGSDEEEDEE